MRRHLRFHPIGSALLLGVLGAASLCAQFTVTLRDDDTIRTVPPGGTVSLNAPAVGQATTARLIVTFDGAGNNVAEVKEPTLEGSQSFSATIDGGVLPLQLNSGESAAFLLRFDPNDSGPFSAQLTLRLTQTTFNGPTVDRNILVNLNGTAPDFNVSFQLPGGNQTLLGDGEALIFDDTLLGDTQTATLTLTNRGSGAGDVEGVDVSGGAFSLSGLQLLPRTVNAAGSLSYSVAFSPDAVQTFGGTMTVRFGGGSSRTVALAGSGIDSRLEFELVTSVGTTPVSPGQTLTLPATNVDEEAEFELRLTNASSVDAAVAPAQVSGRAFRFRTTPITPINVPAGATTSVTLVFAPTEVGTESGALRLGDAIFVLEGDGLGSQLSFAATSAGETSDIAARDTVVFPLTELGEKSTITFAVSNTGNVTERINSIGVSGSAYALVGRPALPAQLEPGGALSFTVEFEPGSPGPASGNLSIDATIFPLSGVGDDLPVLPTLTIVSPGSTVDAAGQYSAGVSLASGYPVPLSGTLSLAFTSDVFSGDPAIQFSNGSRNITFTIPANATEAVFDGGSPQAFFQSGTVAGRIRFSATVTSDLGNVNLTPDPAPEATARIAAAAPELRSVRLNTTNNAGFSVFVTGFATSRSLASLSFQLTAAPDQTLDVTSLSADVADTFAVWYNGNQSGNFGSQFTATVTFTVDGTLDAIQSISVTAVNELGTSNSVSADLF